MGVDGMQDGWPPRQLMGVLPPYRLGDHWFFKPEEGPVSLLRAKVRAISAKSLIANVRFRYLGMGFFWACCMLTFRSSGALPTGIDITMLYTTLLLLSFGVNIATMVTFSLVECKHPGTVGRLPAGAFAMIIIAGLMCLNYADRSEGGLSLFFCGATLVGIGYGSYWGMWAETYSHFHPDITSVSLPLNFILTVTIYSLVSAVSENLGIPATAFMVVLPVISWALLRRCRADERYDRTPNTIKNIVISVLSLEQLLLISAVLSFFFGLLWESSVLLLGSVDQSHQVPLLIALATTAFLFLFNTIGRKRWNMNMLYRYGVPVIAVAFVLFPIFFMSNPILVNSVLGAGFSILEVLIWIASVSVAYDNRVSGFVVGTVVRSTFLIFRLIGIALGYFLFNLHGANLVSLTVMATFGIATMASITYLSWRGRTVDPEDIGVLDPQIEDTRSNGSNYSGVAGRKSGSDSAKGGPAQSDQDSFPDTLTNFKMCCDAVSERYNLSRREAEVLPYLAQGRTAKFISDELFISESTVRTHIRHIIEKTKAKSKQDIIDIVLVHGAELCTECIVMSKEDVQDF